MIGVTPYIRSFRDCPQEIVHVGGILKPGKLHSLQVSRQKVLTVDRRVLYLERETDSYIEVLRGHNMTSKIESDLSSLCEEARKLGAIDAKAIKSSDIVVDPRVTLKCRVPLCAYYGNSLMCPPNVISASEFQEVLTRYGHAVLVQIEVAIPEEVIQAAKNAANLAELFADKNYVKRMLSKAKGLHEVVNKVEATAFNMGYRLAAGFSGGTCTLCDECVTKKPGEPCRHPFEARPSMEAVGVDVLKTVEKAGFKAAAPTMEKLVVYGMVLVD